MKTRIFCATIATILISQVSFALVSRNVIYGGTPAFCWRDSTTMRATNQVMGVVDIYLNGIEPPSTNAANGYVGPTDERSTSVFTPPAVGYDGADFGYGSNLVYGQVLGLLEGNATGVLAKAVYRAFSALNITQAAYYADGGLADLYAGAPPTNFTAAYTVSNINPAYAMMAFDLTPITYYPGGGNIVSGSVNTIVAGSTNQLANTAVMVYYRTNVATAWISLGAFNIGGNGDFTGTFSGVITQMMVGMTASASTLPHSLLGQGPVTPIEGVKGGSQADVEWFSILLNTNDFVSIALSWSNTAAAVNVIVCTNQYYTTNVTAWFALSNNVTSPWKHNAGAYSSIYYRIASGIYTSKYSVGKMSFQVPQPSPGATGYKDSWLASPFDFIDNKGQETNSIGLKDLGIESACTTTGIAGDRDRLAYQSTFGGGTLYYYYLNNNWTANALWYRNRTYMLSINKVHSNVVSKAMTLWGRVPTNDPVNTFIIPQPAPGATGYKDSWVAATFPWPVTLIESGVSNACTTTGIAGERDRIAYQNTIAGGTLYYYFLNGNWTGGATFYPPKGYLISINKVHSNVTTKTWVQPLKPIL